MADYISNKEFTLAIAAYIVECNDREDQGLEAKEIPKNIALQFIALANKLGSRYNFVNYTFKDEMVSSAIYACCNKIRKFKIEVSTNAFAYFTNVCWRAMVDVITMEEKHSYIKAKCFQNVDYDESLDDGDMSNYEETSSGGNVSSDYIQFFDIGEYEKKMSDAKEKARAMAKMEKIPKTTIQLDL